MTEPTAPSTETTPAARPAEPAPAPLPPPAATRTGMSAAGCLRDAILVILGALTGVALTLGLLFYINGALDFGRHERVTALASNLETLAGQQQQTAAQVGQQQTALGQLSEAAQSRFGQMDAMAGQVAALETEAAGFAQQVDQTETELAALDAALQTVAGDNEAIRAQTDALAAQVATLSVGAERFRVFVAGLRDLTTALAGQPASAEPVTEVEPAESQTEAAQLPATPALVFFPPLEPIPQPAPGQSLIYGLAWADANADGQPSADETALASWQVNLRDARGRELAAAITDAAGRFIFADLVPGSYTLILVAPDDADAGAQPPTLSVATGPDLLTEANLGLLRP
ncbi:MAG: hypothetical protein K1X65_07530 [Caldilineales bacterium]|nr:hypothetical protein [Caldilineales bacterium]MCW5861150.1 hypothetical protein [Caldilineales bacterium]